LRAAGYEVLRLPDKFTPRLCHPLDDHIEAFKDYPAGADYDATVNGMMDEVDGIVRKYGGICHEGGLTHFPLRFGCTRYGAGGWHILAV